MRHSIDTIIAGCDKEIEVAEAAEAKRFKEMTASFEHEVAKIKEARRVAANRLRLIADMLDEGHEPRDVDMDYLNDFRWKQRHALLNPPVPSINQEPAKAWIYTLRRVMLNLRRVNPGATTVSTSFLKDAGFPGPAVQWAVRLKP